MLRLSSIALAVEGITHVSTGDALHRSIAIQGASRVIVDQVPGGRAVLIVRGAGGRAVVVVVQGVGGRSVLIVVVQGAGGRSAGPLSSSSYRGLAAVPSTSYGGPAL